VTDGPWAAGRLHADRCRYSVADGQVAAGR